MRRQNFSNYQGRTTAREMLRILIILLAVLLFLAVAALLFGQRYIVYTDEGIRLDIPFFRQEESPSSGGLSGPVKVIEVPGDDTSKTDQSVPETQPDPEPEPEPEVYWMRAVWMTLDELESGGMQAVRQANANTVVLDMKQEDGRLNYVSALPLAQDLDAEQDRISSVMELLHAENIRVIARVSCFRDNILGNKDEYAILTNSGYRWRYDDVNRYWVSPTNERIREYIADVVGELAALGFDEILLENCNYPIQGELGWIRRGDAYDLDRLKEYIGDMLDRAQKAVEGTDAVLSLYTYPRVLNGEDFRSGQEAAVLAGMNGRLWMVDDGQTEFDGLLQQAGITDGQNRLVRIVNSFTPGEDHQCCGAET